MPRDVALSVEAVGASLGAVRACLHLAGDDDTRAALRRAEAELDAALALASDLAGDPSPQITRG